MRRQSRQRECPLGHDPRRTREDFPRLAEIELDAFVVWAEACGVTQEPVSAPVFLLEQSLHEELLLVAEEAGRVVGFTLGLSEGGTLYIVEVDVERAAQGRGVGTSLILAMLDRGRERGFAKPLSPRIDTCLSTHPFTQGSAFASWRLRRPRPFSAEG